MSCTRAEWPMCSSFMCSRIAVALKLFVVEKVHFKLMVVYLISKSVFLTSFNQLKLCFVTCNGYSFSKVLRYNTFWNVILHSGHYLKTFKNKKCQTFSEHDVIYTFFNYIKIIFLLKLYV